MVLERLFPEAWLESKIRYAFIIAVVYSTISIVISRLLFSANSGIVSVTFTSLFILPYLQKMLKKEEREEEREGIYKIYKKRDLLSFLKKNQAIRVYSAIFLGIYLTYLAYSFILPQLGFSNYEVFREQMAINGPKGQASFDDYFTGNTYLDSANPENWASKGSPSESLRFSYQAFLQIALNNWWILLACFLLSIVMGDGGIFFLTWNASAWGTVIGFRALTAGIYSGESAFGYLIVLSILILPHFILEAGAYILAAISGGIISEEMGNSKYDVRKFIAYLAFGAGAVFLLRSLLRNLLGNASLLFGFATLILVIIMIYAIGINMHGEKLRKVFKNNYYLFLLGVTMFIIGALVETFVLNNFSSISRIYALSMLYLS